MLELQKNQNDDILHYIIFCKPSKGSMGVSKIINQVDNEKRIKEITKIKNIYKKIKIERDKIDEFVQKNIKLGNRKYKIHIFYPHQLSKRVNVNRKYNQLHYIFIHDLFPLEIPHIYMRRQNDNIVSYNNLYVNNFIENILTFDVQITLYPSYKIYNLPFKKTIHIVLNQMKQYKINTEVDKKLILYPAQQQIRKNMKSLNDTLKKYNLDTKIMVTGNDNVPNYDKEEIKKLKSNKSKNLEFLDYLEESEYQKIISKVTGFIYPSIAEGGCLVIEELLMTYKPIAVNNYKNLFLSIVQLIGLKMSDNTKKQIFFTDKYKFEKDCEMNKILKSNYRGIYDKLFILNEICKIYIPTIRIYDSHSLLSTKNSIDWINNFKIKEEDKNKLDNIYKNYKEKIEIIDNNDLSLNSKNFGKLKLYNELDIKKLESIKNIYKNKRIFIFGNGPSLNKMDLELFKNEYTFCNNKFFSKKLQLKPFFYYFNNTNEVDDIKLFCNGDLDKLNSCIFMDNRYLFSFNYFLKYFITSSFSNFSTNNIDFGINGSIIGTSIQVAKHLGFSEIYLVGCKYNIKYGSIYPKDLKNISHQKNDNSITGSRIFNVSPTNRSLLIIGNGPSTKNLDFSKLKNIDTFMMNASYRKFDDINYSPTYFSCCDSKMIFSHYKKYLDLIKKYPIKEFYFTNHILQKIPNIKNYKNVNIVSNIPPHRMNNNVNIIDTTDIKKELFSLNDTGAYSTLIGCLKGYKRIYLIGCDLNYIEQIKESNKKINNKNQEFLQMEKTPEKNPNYWFDDYQQKGDIYNIPNGKEMHLPGWEAIKKYTDFYNIEIFNCSDISEIPYFKFYDIKKIYN